MQLHYARINGLRKRFGAPNGSVFALFTLILNASLAPAQMAGPCSGAQVGKIACLFPDVVNGAVQSVSPSFQLDPRIPIGTSIISTQLTSSLPMPAPSAGYTFKYDSNLGTMRAERQSYGPIYGERAETIGLRKFAFSLNSQFFTFDKVDGIDLHDQHSQLLFGDYAASNRFNHEFRAGQKTLTAIYGLRDRLDVSLAVPLMSVSYSLGYQGAFQSVGTGQSAFTASGSGRRSANGLGDINVEVKGAILRGERASLAAGTTLRLPTGDPYNVLGSGAAGVRPFVAASLLYKKLAPHVNVAYLLNGKSVLAADSILSGEKRRIPSQFQYAFGADAGVTDRLTLAFEILGFEAIHADRLGPSPVASLIRQSFNVTNGSAGFKVRAYRNMLVQASGLFRLNNAGLHSKFVPLLGVSYLF